MKNEVINAIDSERAYQDQKYPNSEHTAGEWILTMEKCLSDAKRVRHEQGDVAALHEIRQVVAVGVAAMEALGAPVRNFLTSARRRNWNPRSFAADVQSDSLIGGNFVQEECERAFQPMPFAVLSTLDVHGKPEPFVRTFPDRETAVRFAIDHLKKVRPQFFDGAKSEYDVLVVINDHADNHEWFVVLPIERPVPSPQPSQPNPEPIRKATQIS